MKDIFFCFGRDTILAAILCLPKEADYKTTEKYIELKTLLPTKPILNYTTSLGNKELLNEVGEKTCGIIGVDWQLDL